MGRLDELDLSLKLSRADEADRLSAAQERRNVGDGRFLRPLGRGPCVR